MPYIVNNTRGQIVAVIADGTINTSATSQTLVGKNVTPYGEYEVENLVHQLENFANSTAPGHPLEGQIWYNTTEEKMYAYSGEEWKPVSGLTVSTSSPTLDPRQGDLWFDPITQQVKVYSPVTSGLAWVPVSKVTVAPSTPTTVAAGELYFNSNTKQLFASDGTTWSLIGPEAVADFGTTRWISTGLLDTGSIEHAVILGQVDGVTQAIVSSDTFTILVSARPSGFVNLVPGINLASGSIINGRSASADQLTTPRYINGVAFDGTANVTIPSSGTLTAGTYLVGDPYSGTVPQTWSVDATPVGTPSTVVARDGLGDFTARVISADLVGTVTGTATNVSGLVLPAQGGTGQSSYIPGDILLAKSNGALGRGRVLGSQYINVNDTDNITISYTGGAGNGSVTSVGITTVGDGIGISNSPITTAGNIQITNTGVTRLNTSTGLSVNSVNGNVTMTNTGVTRLNAGTGVSLSGTTGNITISSTPGVTGVTKVSVSGSGIGVTPGIGTGDITLTNTGVTRLIQGSGVSISAETGAITISANPGTSGVSRIQTTGNGISMSPSGGTGVVTLSNSGVTRLRPGTGVVLSAETGDIVITATGGGGGNGISQIQTGAGLTGGPITSAGTIAVDSTVLRSNVAQSVTSLKTFTGGVISQAYNFTSVGSSIFYADATYPSYQEPVVQIAVDNFYAHQFYKKRFVVEGSADVTTPGSNRPAGATIIGIDNGISGGGGVFGWHTNNIAGLGIGTGAYATNMSFTGAVFQGITSRPASGDFVQIRSYSLNDIVFEVRGNGNVYYAGSITAPGSDYAEYFEWADGNPNAEDRVGYTVSLDGNKIKLAETGENIVGVVSAVPAVLGDGAELGWKDQYLKDDWGRVLTEEYQSYDWTDEDGKKHSVASYEDLSSVPEHAELITIDGFGNPLTRPCPNPAYNKDATYVPRSQRPEWAAIGLIGKLRVRKEQVTGANWIKLRDVTEYIEEWLVK